MEYYATINSLSNDGLLKKSFIKRAIGPDAGQGASSEDLTSVFFKCNFDLNFIQEVSKKVGFLLDEFLVAPEGKEA